MGDFLTILPFYSYHSFFVFFLMWIYITLILRSHWFQQFVTKIHLGIFCVIWLEICAFRFINYVSSDNKDFQERHTKLDRVLAKKSTNMKISLTWGKNQNYSDFFDIENWGHYVYWQNNFLRVCILIFIQNYFQFCIPPLKTWQPLLSYLSIKYVKKSNHESLLWV